MSDPEFIFQASKPRKDYKNQIIPVNIDPSKPVLVVNPKSWNDLPESIPKSEFVVTRDEVVKQIKEQLKNYSYHSGPYIIHSLKYEYESPKYYDEYWSEERVVVYVDLSRPMTSAEKSYERNQKTAAARKEKTTKKKAINAKIKTLEVLIKESESEDELVILKNKVKELQEELLNI